ncbi:hypothetical protein EYF80_034760 [Liparis tanakae]|uniref:Uncharacterized protein n=1 Tax=Liparis tanakae TaxID=230148 RepID=A0A4Z2GQQ8_9TELE|nr:hypothetical protein EYF80_034760 [Liparis tanakae]
MLAFPDIRSKFIRVNLSKTEEPVVRTEDRASPGTHRNIRPAVFHPSASASQLRGCVLARSESGEPSSRAI